MSSGGEKRDEAGRLRKKTGQQGKKEVGEAGREDSIKGEEDKKWKPMDGGEGDCQQEKQRRDRTGRLSRLEPRVHCALIRGSQVHCSANHIISCLPYGFQDNVGKAKADVSCATAGGKKKICVYFKKCATRNLPATRSVFVPFTHQGSQPW